MNSDYGFNIGTVFGGPKRNTIRKGKKGKKGKTNSSYSIGGFDGNFLSYVKSGDENGGMGGFTSYLHAGNEHINSGRRDDFLAYIPDIGSGIKDQDTIEEFGHSITKSERQIVSSNKNAAKKYREHKERVEKEREEAQERKKAKRLLEDNLSSARERTERTAKEFNDKRAAERERVEEKKQEREAENMNRFNNNVRHLKTQKGFSSTHVSLGTGRGDVRQVSDEDREDLR